MPAARLDLLDPAEVARLGGIEIEAEGVVEGFLAGLHRSPFRGFSVEFTEHRAYQAGDELRYLDWRILGRSDRLFVKQFEEETNLRSMILVDASRSMAWRGATERLTKRAYADRRAALSAPSRTSRDRLSPHGSGRGRARRASRSSLSRSRIGSERGRATTRARACVRRHRSTRDRGMAAGVPASRHRVPSRTNRSAIRHGFASADVTFIHPLALLGLAAAAIPALLHLLQRRVPPELDFPAVRYLSAAERESARRLKLRHLLLLILRTALIIVIVLAAARPLVRVRGGGAAWGLVNAQPARGRGVQVWSVLRRAAVVRGGPGVPRGFGVRAPEPGRAVPTRGIAAVHVPEGAGVIGRAGSTAGAVTAEPV